MAVDHKRPLPVAPERLDAIAGQLWPGYTYARLSRPHQVKAVQIALQAELVEQAERTNFFLQEAYEIYNARFR